MRLRHHATLFALGAALAGLVIVPSVGDVSVADPTVDCGVKVDGFYQVTNASQLAAVGRGEGSPVCQLSDSYSLVSESDIDLAPLLNGDSWTPIGSVDKPFVGTLSGNGTTIKGLAITGDPGERVTWGLFGVIGEGGAVDSVILEDVTIELAATSATRDSYLGSIAGISEGEISGVRASGKVVTVGVGVEVTAGGLVGYSVGRANSSSANGRVSDAFADVETSADAWVGGLVGLLEDAEIITSTAEGNVTGRNDAFEVGGLVGQAVNSVVSGSHATGNVASAFSIGGLIGSLEEESVVMDSTAQGSVLGTNYVGGLVGFADERSSILRSHALGNVVGNKFVGGLAGAIFEFVVINDSSAFGDVQGAAVGTEYVGGLAGLASNSTIERSVATGVVTSALSSRFIGGLVGELDNGSFVNDSYATGNVSAGAGSSSIANLVGQIHNSTVQNSYATGSAPDGGGIVDTVASSGGDVQVLNSYWDSQSAGFSAGARGEAKTSAQMREISTFTDWDISAAPGPTTIWGIHPTRNAGYPFLSWQTAAQNAFCQPGEPSLLDRDQAASDDNPYLVSHPRHLLWLAGADKDVSNALTLEDENDEGPLGTRLDGDYRQVVSFSLAECDWLPIGRVREQGGGGLPFTGTYDGGNHSLAGLNIEGGREDSWLAGVSDELGLFGRLNGEVQNLTLEAPSVTGGNDIGALAGTSRGSVVKNVTLEGPTVSGERRIGGLVGDSQRAPVWENISIRGAVLSAVHEAGGLAGNHGVFDGIGARVSDCSVEAEITRQGTRRFTTAFGGLFGYLSEARQVEKGPEDQSRTDISDCSIKLTIVSLTTTTHAERFGGAVGNLSLSTPTDPDGNNRVRFRDLDIDFTVKASGPISQLGGVVGDDNAIVEDVHVALTIENTNSDGDRLNLGTVGGIFANTAGRDDYGPEILRSSATVKTVGNFGSGRFGGLAGYGNRGITITESAAELDVELSGVAEFGGLVGQFRGGTIEYSKASGTATLASGGVSNVRWGGIAGRSSNQTVTVRSSYSDLTINATLTPVTSLRLGGMVGHVERPTIIENSYSNTRMTVAGAENSDTIGAVFGDVARNLTITNSFYNESLVSPPLPVLVETAPETETVTGVVSPLSSAQIGTIAPFRDAGWPIIAATANRLPAGPDENEVWGIVDGGLCGPFLWWEEGRVAACQQPAPTPSPSSETSSKPDDQAEVPDESLNLLSTTPFVGPAPNGFLDTQEPDSFPGVNPSGDNPSGDNPSGEDLGATGEEDSGTRVSGEGESEALSASASPGGGVGLWTIALIGLGLLGLAGGTAVFLQVRGRLS